MTLMFTVIGLSTQMFRRQSNSVSAQTGRLDAQQNSRFAISMLERELRVAGAGVADQQPLLVMAGALGVTFNTNLVSLDTGDLSAVYINPDADSASSDLLRTTDKITLPGTTTQYPDTNYMLNAGLPSHAETISYWLERDSTSSKASQYALYRRVNARPPRLVARGLIYTGVTDSIFQYFKSDTLGNLTKVSPSVLPLIHTAPIHGLQSDTGRSALTDSIKQIRIRLTSVFRDPRTPKDSTLRTQTLTIHLMNAGLLHHATCGQPPIPPTAIAATATAANGTTIPQTYVTVTWTKSTDDGAAEKDVEKCTRSIDAFPTVTTFDEPIGSVPSGGVGLLVPRHRCVARSNLGLCGRVAGLHAGGLDTPRHYPRSFREDSLHENQFPTPPPRDARACHACSGYACPEGHRAVRLDVLRGRHWRARPLGDLIRPRTLHC